MKAIAGHTKNLSETLEVSLPKIRLNAKVLIFFQWLISFIIPLALLLVYQNYANEHGITLEKGCEGPGVPFGMMSGILFLLQLKYFPHSEEHKE